MRITKLFLKPNFRSFKVTKLYWSCTVNPIIGPQFGFGKIQSFSLGFILQQDKWKHGQMSTLAEIECDWETIKIGGLKSLVAIGNLIKRSND